MKQLSLKYLIKEPKIEKEKNPLILLLHGYGSNEEDLFSFANELPEDYYVVSARAPYNLQYGSYAWYSINFDADENKFSDDVQAVTSRNLIVQFIDEITAEYPIDIQKIVLTGFSQGAILSYAVAVSNPKKIEKIAALSGYVNERIFDENYKTNDFSTLKIFASHGTVDQVIPIDWARRTKPFLDSLNVNITYKEYPIGHGISAQNFYDYKNWLLE